MEDDVRKKGAETAGKQSDGAMSQRIAKMECKVHL